MKMMKLMTATALATVTIFGSFIESAKAQRRPGNSYSEPTQNVQQPVAQFNLFDQSRDGNFIVDQEPQNDELGLFIGAIENYGFLRLITDENGNTTGSEFTQELDVGDLEADLIGTLDFGNAGISYNILAQGTGETIARFLLDNLGSDIDTERAVNDLTYILEQNLLGDAFSSSSGTTLSLRSRFEEEISGSPDPEPIPEPNATAGILALGILGAGLRLKRKLKRN